MDCEMERPSAAAEGCARFALVVIRTPDQYIFILGTARCGRAGDFAEHGPRHEPGAPGVIRIKQAANHFARCVETGNRAVVNVDHMNVGYQVDAADSKGNLTMQGSE